jgi:hypothetical protein
MKLTQLAIAIASCALPSRPEYPQDSTRLDEWDRKMRTGKLPSGSVARRIEGGDVPLLLAWKKTRHYSESASLERENRLLDEFLETRGERLIADPLKRAFLQRDLWAVFDHLVGQNIAQFGDADLARRRAPMRDYEVEPGDLKHDDPAAMQRRETLCRKPAVILQRLALPKAAIEALPDNYAAAVRSAGLRRGTSSIAAAIICRPACWPRRTNGWRLTTSRRRPTTTGARGNWPTRRRASAGGCITASSGVSLKADPPWRVTSVTCSARGLIGKPACVRATST